MTPTVRTLRVSEKGQVVLPADVRRAMGIEKGTELVLVFDGERMLLQKEGRVAAAMQEDFSGLLAASEAVLRDVWENEDDAAWDRV
jgi:AbrB family looped-hinge helix DNA binding protein